MSAQLTVGVIGHVDHGKTSLVKALTGIDTDRLAEEKERGLSIVLGYAYIKSGGGMIDLIDTPGHESFIRTMIAGATGIDSILLIIAADEGIKPQTREHFDIARLLGIRSGVIAITKSDLVDEDRLQHTVTEIREYVRGTPLEEAELVPVSSVDHRGIPELTRALDSLFKNSEKRAVGENFYLPLDRVFTIEGFGTVATGTLRDGPVETGTEVEIMPTGLTAGIRELQVHNEKVERALPGQRVAINLRGLKREQLAREQKQATPGSLQPTRRIYCRLEVLEDLPRLPRRNELVRVLYVTTDVVAKLRVIGDKPLDNGTEFMVQLYLQKPVITSKGDAFILRACSPSTTIGGGEIIETSDCLSNVIPADLGACLEKLHSGTPAEQLSAYLDAAGSNGIGIIDLVQRLKTTRAGVGDALESARGLLIDEFAMAGGEMKKLCKFGISQLEEFHRHEPDAAGQTLEAFRATLTQRSPGPVAEYAIQLMTRSEEIDISSNTVRLSGFDSHADISAEEKELIDTIEGIFREGGVSTPSLEEVIGQDPSRRIAYQHLKDQGRLVTVTNAASRKQFVFHADTINRIKEDLVREFPSPKKFTVSDIRTLLDSSRKYVVPLLEHFDKNRLTIRHGDYRVITSALAQQDRSQGVQGMS